MRLTSESPFIWVYNQTLPTKTQSAEYDKRVANISLFIYIGLPGLHRNSRQVPGSSRHSVITNRLLAYIIILPLRICLPGTELLQSPFRSEFSMGSLLRRYRWSLRRHRWFLRRYRRSLLCCHAPWGDRRSPMGRCRSFRNSLNIIKRCST